MKRKPGVSSVQGSGITFWVEVLVSCLLLICPQRKSLSPGLASDSLLEADKMISVMGHEENRPAAMMAASRWADDQEVQSRE